MPSQPTHVSLTDKGGADATRRRLDACPTRGTVGSRWAGSRRCSDTRASAPGGPATGPSAMQLGPRGGWSGGLSAGPQKRNRRFAERSTRPPQVTPEPTWNLAASSWSGTDLVKRRRFSARRFEARSTRRIGTSLTRSCTSCWRAYDALGQRDSAGPHSRRMARPGSARTLPFTPDGRREAPTGGTGATRDGPA